MSYKEDPAAQKIIDRLDSELAKAQKRIGELVSQEPCPKCGSGIESACYGCRLKDAEAKIEKLRSLNHEAADMLERVIKERGEARAALPEVMRALLKSNEALAEAREMLSVLEDNGGHDGLMGKGLVATLDHIDTARKANVGILMRWTAAKPATKGEKS